MNLCEILGRVCVLNKDNGREFTNTARLDFIAEFLKDSNYIKINSTGLFHLYASRNLNKSEPVIIVSSHIDCEEEMTKCFYRHERENMLLGTFDNAITNASALYVMKNCVLPDNVIFAFTGDEESDMQGVYSLKKYLVREKIHVERVIVLDVTDMGWDRSADFTIENDFQSEEFGRRLIDSAMTSNYEWFYVPYDIMNIPGYIKPSRIIRESSEEDESWYYSKFNIECFSLCIPVFGDMHSNEGVYARKNSFENYTGMLERVLMI
ncbi:MAG: hypothetical protein IJP48_11010 [Synergistaceae bacterium]|nr:hypothetical protein [Synergistaceae bacterium]